MTDEVLVEITNHFVYDKATLRILATVNIKLNRIATQILAQIIDVYVQTPR